MELLKLTLTNFEGIKSLTLDFDGKSAAIYGDNGTGKTTIADAQAWLLFGKDSAFTQNFLPKPRDDQGEELHNLDTEVEGIYRLDDGTEITLRKVFAEIWKKKRGSTEAVFSGHTVSYYVDGVPKKEKEYNDILESIADIQALMLLSMPQYFPEILDIKKRRELLMSLEKDIHEFDVISACAELEPLRHLMLKPGATANWYDMDEFVQIEKAAAKKANDDLKEIPGRIDELTRVSCELTDADIEKLKAESGRLNAEKIARQLEMNASETEMMSSLRADIAKLNTKMEEKRAEYLRKCASQNEGADKKLADLRKQQYERIGVAQEIRAEAREVMREIERIRTEREIMLTQWKEVSASSWQGDTVCPTCGQAIPEDKLTAAKEEFNLKKSQKLAELNEKGKSTCSKEMLAAAEDKYEALNSKAIVEESAAKKIEKEIDSLRGLMTEDVPFEQTDIYAEIKRDIETTQAQLDALGETRSRKNAENIEKIAELDTRITAISADIARYDASAASRERIAELEKQEKQLAEAYAKARQGLDLAELFERKKAEMLTEKINAHFHNVKFRLFRVQINEGIKTDCEVLALTANGYIPYSTANNAARITAGLEIIRGFSDKYGIKMPVFVDNAESITKLDTNGLQVIRLVVSAEDKTLRFESEE